MSGITFNARLQRWETVFLGKPAQQAGFIQSRRDGVWYTNRPKIAKKVWAWMTSDAKFALEVALDNMAEQIEASAAPDADITIPCPEGLAYKGYQKACVAYARSRSGVLIADEMGLGKAQPLDAKILTPDGWRRMGDLAIGDLVVGRDGRPTRVSGIFPQGPKEIFRVTFNDGSSTECCDDHLWEVKSPLRRWRNNGSRTLSLKAIRARLVDAAGNRRHHIPMIEPQECSEKSFPLDPYLLGVLLGDGCFTQSWVHISSADDDLLERVIEVLPGGLSIKHLKNVDYAVTSGKAGRPNEVTRQLKILRLHGLGSDHKFIPDMYKFGSVSQRQALLQGLMDTDGYVSVDGVTQFSSNSERLIMDLREIVHSLGGNARISKKVSASGKDHFLATLCLPESIIPFHIARKANRYSPRLKYKPTRAFASVESIGFKEAQCIRVEAKDHLYVTDDYIVTHNTIEAIACVNDDPTISLVLIVVKAQLRINWSREWRKWNTSHILPSIATDSFPIRLDRRAVIVSYHQLKKWYARIMSVRWDVLICDEAHALINFEAQRTKLVVGLKRGKDKRPPIQARKYLFLTGTPLVNKPADLFPMLTVLDPTGLGRSKDEFYRNYVWTTDNLAELNSSLRARCMIRRVKKDVMGELPPKRRQIITVEAKDADALVKREQEALAQVQANLARSKADIDGGSYADAVLRLKQCQTTALSEIAKVRHATAMAKLPSVIEHLHAILEEEPKLVVFAHHHDVVDGLLAAFPRISTVVDGRTDGPTSQRNVDRFQQDPAVKLMVGSIRKMEGWTMTAASVCAFAELDWTPTALNQAEDRLHRIGQTDSVMVYHFVIDGSIDARMAAVNVVKQGLADTILDGAKLEINEQMKSILETVLGDWK